MWNFILLPGEYIFFRRKMEEGIFYNNHFTRVF
jgi:hypothetical protein